MGINKSKILALDEANAEVLVELITAPNISESLRIQAMAKLTEARTDTTFSRTLMDEKLSYGECPKCQHVNHWLLTEDDANQMGWVSHKEDDRVPEHTDEKNCPIYQQSCKKKRVTT
jgi:hypothetical protein